VYRLQPAQSDVFDGSRKAGDIYKEETAVLSEIYAIIAIVERGKADYIVNKAKASGAGGATILFGRGTGQEEFKRMFHHLHVESSKEIIIILSQDTQVESILSAIVEAGKLKEPGKGIAFTVPVTHLVGLDYRKKIETTK
jgi:nitrogen regulatory protein P-II 1